MSIPAKILHFLSIFIIRLSKGFYTKWYLKEPFNKGKISKKRMLYSIILKKVNKDFRNS